ncbi:MAG TPA: hypothetical protein VJK54_11105, partial [Chthoniobacterales bacterium]|nr:hypothetical protein [Chthoniobacterales bacterium]
MKKIIPSILLAASAISSLLLAQAQNRLEVRGDRLKETENQSTDCRLQALSREQGTGAEMAELPLVGLSFQIDRGGKTTTNYESPTANCDNSSLDLSYHLMMDPAELKNLEEGIEGLKGVFGSPGKTANSSKTPLGTAATTHSPVGNSSSNAAITGQRGVESTATALTEESGEGTGVSKFLEDEICNNIYMSCLAKVATISLAERKTAEGISQEMKEWVAAEKKAKRDVEKSKKVLEKATRERETAGKKLDSFKASLHGKAYIDEAYYEFQVKELAEKLAEARVATAEATLFAIEVKDTAQSAGAAADIKEAIEEERKAFDALTAATVHSSREETSTFSSPVKQEQVTPKTAGKISMGGEGVDASQSSINLAASQSSLLFTPPKPPTSIYETTAVAHSFVDPSIPMVEAVAIPSENNLTGGDSLNYYLVIQPEKTPEKEIVITSPSTEIKVEQEKVQPVQVNELAKDETKATEKETEEKAASIQNLRNARLSRSYSRNGKTAKSLFALPSFIPNTWYDEQIIATEKAEKEAREKLSIASTQLEEVQKALKILDDKIEEENGKVARAKLATLKKQFQVHLQEVQSERETVEQTVTECAQEVKVCQLAVEQTTEKTQKARTAKEIAVKTIYVPFHEIGKDLVEGIEMEQQEFARDQRVLEAITKIDHERIEKEKTIQQLAIDFEAE